LLAAGYFIRPGERLIQQVRIIVQEISQYFIYLFMDDPQSFFPLKQKVAG
jgi:hypothetical protein